MKTKKSMIVRFYQRDIDLYHKVKGLADKLGMKQNDVIKLAIKHYGDSNT